MGTWFPGLLVGGLAAPQVILSSRPPRHSSPGFYWKPGMAGLLEGTQRYLAHHPTPLFDRKQSPERGRGLAKGPRVKTQTLLSVSALASEPGGQEPQTSLFLTSLSSPLPSAPNYELFCLFPCCSHLSGKGPGRGMHISRGTCGVGPGDHLLGEQL